MKAFEKKNGRQLFYSKFKQKYIDQKMKKKKK